MRPFNRNLAIFAISAALAGGCGGHPAPVKLEPVSLTRRVDCSDLAAVLSSAVRKDGTVDGKKLEEMVGRLDTQLRRLAVVGPTATADLYPTCDAKLAYWNNARSAGAMKLVLLAGCPAKLTRRELLDRPFRLDGRTMSLAKIDAVLARDDDWAALVAAPGISIQRAGLQKRPFSGGDIRRRIQERLSGLVEDGSRFVIDVAHRKVRLPPVLWGVRRRIIGRHHAEYRTGGATLINYADEPRSVVRSETRM